MANASVQDLQSMQTDIRSKLSTLYASATATVVIMVLVVTIYLSIALISWSFVIDDSYISFIYARNLAEGHGLVYNHGEAVEGYSNFLWTVILAGGIKAGFDVLVAAKIFGAVLSIGTILATYALARKVAIRHDWLYVWIAPLLLAFAAPFVLWSIGGLESALHAFTLTTATCLAIYQRGRPALWPLTSAGLVALSMTRVEAAAFAGLILLFSCFWLMRNPAIHSRTIALHALLVAVPVSIWHVWRMLYYGWPLPNTYYAKMGGENGISLGISYLRTFTASTFGGRWLAVLVLLLVVAGTAVMLAKRSVTADHVLLGTLVGAFLAVVVASGGDWMPYHRLIVPVLPLLFITLGVAVEGLAANLSRQRLTVLLHAGIASLFVLILISAVDETRYTIASREHHTHTRDFMVAGRFINEQYPATTTVAAVNAGAMMWVARRPFIDLVGLMDETVAHSDVPARMDGKFITLDYFASREPDVVVLFTLGDPADGCCKAWFSEMEDLYQSAYFQSNYRFVEAFPFSELDGSTSSLLLYERIQ